MENAILTSECSWCGVRYIKERIGVMHGCQAEREAKNEPPAPTSEGEQVIDLMRR